MKHLKSFPIKESLTDTKDLIFKKYVDYMSTADSNRMNKILEKNPSSWTQEEKDFMKRMSKKDVALYLGSDGNTYTENDLEFMGVDKNKINRERPKDASLTNDIKDLISTYNEALKKTKGMVEKHKEEYNIVKLISPVLKNLDMIVYELNKIK